MQPESSMNLFVRVVGHDNCYFHNISKTLSVGKLKDMILDNLSIKDINFSLLQSNQIKIIIKGTVVPGSYKLEEIPYLFDPNNSHPLTALLPSNLQLPIDPDKKYTADHLQFWTDLKSTLSPFLSNESQLDNLLVEMHQNLEKKLDELNVEAMIDLINSPRFN